MYLEYKTEQAAVSVNVPSETFVTFDDDCILRSIEKLNGLSLGRSEFIVSPANAEEAKWLLHAFCVLSSEGRDIPSWLVRYFAKVYEDILSGTAPKKSLGLVNPSHRPKLGRNVSRDLEIYRHVAKLMAEGESLMNSALDASEKYHLNDSHIQKIYSALKKQIDEEKKLNDEIVEGGYF